MRHIILPSLLIFLSAAFAVAQAAEQPAENPSTASQSCPMMAGPTTADGSSTPMDHSKGGCPMQQTASTDAAKGDTSTAMPTMKSHCTMGAMGAMASTTKDSKDAEVPPATEEPQHMSCCH